MTIRPAVHFVRFDNEWDAHYSNAVAVFGRPDFVHRHWDQRAQREIADVDTVVFAKGDADQRVCPYNYDDSNKAHDPAYWERLR
jgi:hypothetical protein